MELYSREYFKQQQKGAFRSAEIMVPIVLDLVHPASVVDIGCGTGAWLSVFQKHGIHDFLGVDGEYIDRSSLHIPSDRFLSADLEKFTSLERTFDLAISLEVAEHLSPSVATQFITTLTTLAPAVLFSAAIPFQMGTGHVNEQWQSYWAEKFAVFGYRPTSVMREHIWINSDVEVWYRQNAILYIQDEALELKKYAISSYDVIPASSTSVVHPELFLCAADPDKIMISRFLPLLRAFPKVCFNAMAKVFLWIRR